MDIEALLKETADAPPCGPNLEYDADFAAIDFALRPKAEQALGDTLVAAAEPDWQDVCRRAEALLSRTKDLRVAMTLVRALTHTDQLPGFASGLSLVSRLLDQYWDGVHPQLDPADNNDPTMRLNALAGLVPPQGAGGDDALFRDLRAAFVVPPCDAGRVTVRDVLLAAGKLPSPGAEPGLTAAQISGVMRAAATSDPQWVGAARLALETTDRIRKTLVDKLGAEQALDLAPLRELLRAVADTEAAAIEPEPQVEGQPAATTLARGTSGAMAVGEIRSRADAVRAIDQVCAFLERSEPSNPAPLLLRRAQRLMTKTFVEIIEDLAPGGLEQVRTVAGIRDEPS